MTPPLAITLSQQQKPAWEADARAAAERWGVPFFARPHKRGLEPFVGTVAQAFLVRGGDGWSLWDREGALRFTPGMAMLRIKRLMTGEGGADTLLGLAEARAGDVIVDGTLGLGADALVCAYAAGPTGRVLGCEASLALAALVGEGLRLSPPFEGLAPIEVRHDTSAHFLAGLPTASADVVLLDPMFDRPKRSSPAFEVLRRHAQMGQLTAPTLAEARRVARRWVVVKAGRYTQIFRELGITPTHLSRYNDVVWARLPPSGDLGGGAVGGLGQAL